MDDWAASQLDRIVNHRYREMKPIVWTTNLREVELVGLYGAALVSRLCEDNPLTWIENAPSLRIK
jgi:DNA replication protein DnaC